MSSIVRGLNGVNYEFGRNLPSCQIFNTGLEVFECRRKVLACAAEGEYSVEALEDLHQGKKVLGPW